MAKRKVRDQEITDGFRERRFRDINWKIEHPTDDVRHEPTLPPAFGQEYKYFFNNKQES